jgi:hypothetical protein
MRNKIAISAIAGFLVFLGLACPAVLAHEKCSLQTMAGTYAFYEKGASLSNFDPYNADFPYFVGKIAPFLTVGEVTFTPHGVGDGFYWISIGALNGGLDPTPVHVTITEMNEDCTGKFTYSVNLPSFNLSASIVERFTLFDDGREYRSVPTSIENGGFPTLAWFGVGHRIRKSDEPAHSCGPHKAHGTYLLTAENIVLTGAHESVADTLFIREDVSQTGEYTGTLYEKHGPDSIDSLPVFGTYTVNTDCSFSSTLNFYILGTHDLVTIVIKGVFFNEGKEYYALAIDVGVPYSFARGERISQ